MPGNVVGAQGGSDGICNNKIGNLDTGASVADEDKEGSGQACQSAEGCMKVLASNGRTGGGWGQERNTKGATPGDARGYMRESRGMQQEAIVDLLQKHPNSNGCQCVRYSCHRSRFQLRRYRAVGSSSSSSSSSNSSSGSGSTRNRSWQRR
jgi:hypothetical protein